MTVTALVVERHARVVLLGDPGAATEAWLVLHGYGMTARGILHWFRGAAAPHRLLVAPEALSRFYEDRRGVKVVGASWMTSEERDHEIEDQRRYLDVVAERWLPGDRPVRVHGFSQGVATAFRWLAATDHRVDQVVAWAGVLPPELDLADLRRRRPGLTVDLVVGDGDNRVTPAQVGADAARLTAAALAPRLHRFDGGHTVDPDVLAGFAG